MFVYATGQTLENRNTCIFYDENYTFNIQSQMQIIQHECDDNIHSGYGRAMPTSIVQVSIEVRSISPSVRGDNWNEPLQAHVPGIPSKRYAEGEVSKSSRRKEIKIIQKKRQYMVVRISLRDRYRSEKLFILQRMGKQWTTSHLQSYTAAGIGGL